MKQIEVELVPSPGLFRGLAKQNMLFHQCIGELVDNAVAATQEKAPFRIDVAFEHISSDKVNVWIADNALGMSLGIFQQALQLGESATAISRLNEHGFGLKNALATLCAKTDSWDIWSKGKNGEPVMRVKGPFDRKMIISESPFPKHAFIRKDVSTVIRASVHPKFISTVQGRGRPSQDLAVLRPYLIEHLGVHYRGYLEQDKKTGEPMGKIYVSIGIDKKRDEKQVMPVHIPFESQRTEKFEVELDGQIYPVAYTHGTLDPASPSAHKFYYRGDMVSQGIDIRLGRRVIITRQLDTIWDMKRDNHLNYFIGELLIPETPRGVLSTKNDKTDFDMSDPNWEKILQQLQPFTPRQQDGQKTEKELKDNLKGILQLTAKPGEICGTEIPLWQPANVRLDVYHQSANGDITLYELKVGTGQPIHLYQLKMYWDGLVLAGYKPRKAILLAKDFSDAIRMMAKKMNSHLKPPKGSPYAFELLTHKESALSTDEHKKRGRAKRPKN